MNRVGWSSLALVLLVAIGLVPTLGASAQTRRSETAVAAQEAAAIEIITFDCANEPPVDGTLATQPPEGCSDHIWIYSGTIVDSSGIIVSNYSAALADPERGDKFGWQMIGFKQEGDPAPLFAVIAQPILLDESMGLALFYPVFTLDGGPIKEDELNLPAVRLADQGEMVPGSEVTFTGWQMGEDYGDDRMLSVEATVEEVSADKMVPELGDTAKFLTAEAVTRTLMGAGAFTDDGRLVGTAINIKGNEEGTWGRPMPEAIMVLTGEDLGSTVEPEKDDSPFKPIEQVEGTSTVTGSVVSADTGDPIPNALILVFNPGVTVDQGVNEQNPDDVYGVAETDGNGQFRVDPPVVKGELYSMVILADGYYGVAGDDIELAPVDAGDVVDWGVFELASM